MYPMDENLLLCFIALLAFFEEIPMEESGYENTRCGILYVYQWGLLWCVPIACRLVVLTVAHQLQGRLDAPWSTVMKWQIGSHSDSCKSPD
ncbi:hypothetical protein V8C37DRAFT_377572 [Trichoderma ceciliae]